MLPIPESAAGTDVLTCDYGQQQQISMRVATHRNKELFVQFGGWRQWELIKRTSIKAFDGFAIAKLGKPSYVTDRAVVPLHFPWPSAISGLRLGPRQRRRCNDTQQRFVPNVEEQLSATGVLYRDSDM
jgi:hypothetical protein